MRISFSSQQHIGLVNLSYRSNDSSTKNVLDNNEKTEKHLGINKKNMDKSLEASLRKNNILENLMKQKENLMDSKSAIMEKALKDGDNLSSVKEKLKDIDKQIEEIDKQMNKIQLEEQRKALGNEGKDKKGKETNKISNETSTEDEKIGIPKDKMDSMLSLSGSLSQAKALSSQRTSISGEARVLKFEIKIDEGRGINPINKKKRVAQLDENIENINEKINDKLKEVNNQNNDNVQADTSKNAAAKNKKSKDLSSKSNLESEDKLVIEQQKAEQKLKHYNDNSANSAENNGKKINATA
ncbi:hypothetical protein [Clostridium aciditolerans]|uniref:Uncharacterized protein n=1 Tax=Clostridium aciditolerans TaxID=339861 RepID=A0A934M0Q2_9CLOT|nr:hypothetical protein [Clostridium aciditolerans]MBI6872414.1 hypothetical protein [Clostridium aciditolerans]